MYFLYKEFNLLDPPEGNLYHHADDDRLLYGASLPQPHNLFSTVKQKNRRTV
ncbi:hypothetical protein GX408_09290 [bacterium]|nr:hypothetical protein [bacterium]